MAFVAFHFASSAFTVPLLPVPLVAFWLCGFGQLSCFGFSHPLLSQLVFWAEI